MAMPELKQKLLLYELAKIGFRESVYSPEADHIKMQPDNDRTAAINGDGDISYKSEQRDYVLDTIKPLVDRVNEAYAAWEKSQGVPFENLSQFRVLAEYNDIMLAARDDTESGRGLHFVTWRYDFDRTGVEQGFYTEDFNAAKENFAARSGLIPGEKLFTREQAADILATIDYSLENDNDFYLTYGKEESLKSIADTLRRVYPNIETQRKTGQSPAKPKSLAEKMQAAQEKVKTQETQSGKNKTNMRDERE